MKMKWAYTALLSIWLLLFFSISGCEIYSDVLTRPKYEPSLVVHATLSPQEGGQVYLKYTIPVDSNEAQPISALPEVTVELYEDGFPKYTFTRQQSGYFVLEPNGLMLSPEQEYHLIVKDMNGRTILESGKDRLPSLPEIVETRFYQDTSTFPERNYIDVEFKWSSDVETTYHYRKDYSIDSGQVFILERDPMYGRFSIGELIYTTNRTEETIRSIINVPAFASPQPGGDRKPVNAAKLWVDHLSPVLSRFLQDVGDSRDSQGDPFATQKAVFSNIEGGYGIFGLYNSSQNVLYLE